MSDKDQKQITRTDICGPFPISAEDYLRKEKDKVNRAQKDDRLSELIDNLL